MRLRLAGVIALSITGALATAFAHAPQGRGSVTVPQVTPSPVSGQTAQAGPPLVTTGLIVGRVIDAATGTPVAGVIVALNGGPARSQPPQGPSPSGGGRNAGAPTTAPRILTDGEGRFAFRNLTRGTYTLNATKSGYSAGAYGRNRAEGPTRSLQLDDNERVGDMVVKIFKFATITGRITDEAGEPIVGARVVAYRRVLLAGRRRFRENISAQTDDRGIYRLSSLVPADYTIAAPLSAITAPNARLGSEQNFSMSAIISSGATPGLGGGGRQLGPDGRFMLQSDGTALAADASGKWRGYSTQYYPASRTISGAEVLTLASGEDRTGIDIQMRYVPVSTISGTLTVPTGSPANLMMRLIAADAADIAFEPESAVTATDPNGGFMFAAIPSGQYTIQVARVSREPLQFLTLNPGQPGPGGTFSLTSPAGSSGRGQPTPSDPMLWASVPVTVGDSDVTGVTVAMQEGFTITGRFEFTGTHPRPDAQRLVQVPVSVEPADGRDSGVAQVTAPSRVGVDGRFVTAPRLPGKYVVSIGGMPPGFIVQSIIVNGVNATDAPFDLTGDVTNAVITFTDQISSVAGTVRGVDPGDDPPLVVIYPADSRAWKDYGLNPLRMKSTRAAAPGTFTFGSMVAGDYFAVAIPDQFSAEYQDPAYLELLSRGAERFTLGPGEKQTVSVEISSVRPPGAGRDVPVADETAECSCAAPQTTPAATRDQRGPEPTGTGSISGTITVDDGSPRPARLARVRVGSPQGNSSNDRTALTDEAGHYTIAWLPAGDYMVAASKPAFLNASYGAKRLMGVGSVVHIANGQAVNNINITMAKGAVISGVVMDDSGQPATSVRLQLLAFSRREGERVLGSAASAMGPGSNGPPLTNDRGEFRFYGVRPGKYVVMAQPQNVVTGQEVRQLSDSEMRAAMAEAAKAPTPQVVIDTPRTIAPAPPTDVPLPPPVGRAINFSPVYYPGTVFDTEAVEVTAVAGEELNGINVQLRLVPASRIEGRVIGPDGQIATNAQVSLLKFTGSGTSTTGLQQRAGVFQAAGVAAGRYVLTAQLNPEGGRGAMAGRLPAAVSWAQIDLNLNGDDQTDLVLALAPLPTITGRVVFEGAPPPDMGAVRVSIEQAGTGVMSTGRQSGPATPDSNGEFTIVNVMPGKYRLNASVLGPRPPEGMQPLSGPPNVPPAAVSAAAATGWSVASATIAGQDAYVSSFEVRHGQPLSGAEVTMTNKPSEISGKLIDGNNAPVPNMTVVLFPVDRALWVTNAARVNRISRPNATGTFSFPLAVPGEYYLAVLTDLDNADWQEVDFKEQLVPSAIKVTVAKGEKKIQDMKIGGS